MHTHASEGEGASLPDAPPDAQASDTLTPCPPQFRDAERRLLRKSGRLAELTDMQRNVLAAMLRLAVQWKAPEDWFVLSFKKLGVELRRSYNSIDTHVQALRRAGWIERDRDITGARRLGMPIGSTRLTPQTLDALGLHLPPHTQEPGHACRDFKGKSPSERNAPEARPVDNQPQEKTETPAPQREAAVIAADGARIPRDLAPLLIAMSGRQLCGLMKLASPLKVRIQHIAAHAQSAIIAATEPVAYLRTLILSDRDWAVPPREVGPAAWVVSATGTSTRAGWREDQRREREADEHRTALAQERQHKPASQIVAELRAKKAQLAIASLQKAAPACF